MMFDFFEKLFDPASDGLGADNDETSPVAPLVALTRRYNKAVADARQARTRQARVAQQLKEGSVQVHFPTAFFGIDPLIKSAFDEARGNLSASATAAAKALVEVADAALAAELQAIRAEIPDAARVAVQRLEKMMEGSDV